MKKDEPILESPPTDQEKGRIPPTTAEGTGPPRGRRFLAASIGALGVVYGDIGTSPLYALRECFSEQYGIAVSEANVLGVVSLILWSLFTVISIKYLVLVMQADNRGEGGILALMALVDAKGKRSGRAGNLFVVLGLFGAALLYGDGMITPAISVLSAVEGLKVAAPAFGRYVVPMTLCILVGLFVFQKRGTAVVGSIFGPIILIWFLMIATLGAAEILRAPRILAAVFPHHAISFFVAHGALGFFVLGAVFLVVTGGEALYADMGHFGKRPIRFTWFAFVLPALMLNYAGQGALLLRDSAAVTNPFYHLAPVWALYPLVVLATAATVIASQAVISGSFSLTRQAVHLGYSPRVGIEHTSEEEAGQVYIGAVNWVLFAATASLVLGFGSSSALAGAYGVAVTTTMVVTTLLLYVVARDIWEWSLGFALLGAASFLCVDLAFFGANLLKVTGGGWVPLLVAGVVFTLMTTWHRGRELIERRLYESDLPVEDFLVGLDDGAVIRPKGVAVFLTGNTQAMPSALLQNVKHNGVLHETIVLLSISTSGIPYVPRSERLEVDEVGRGFWRVHARYGFMQSPSVPGIFALARERGLDVNPAKATFFFSRKIPVARRRPGMALWRERLFSVMARNSQSVATYIDVPADRVIEIGMPVEI